MSAAALNHYTQCFRNDVEFCWTDNDVAVLLLTQTAEQFLRQLRHSLLHARKTRLRKIPDRTVKVRANGLAVSG